MIPIYEQGGGRGIGHTKKSFSQRFEQLCREHLEQGRARAFAFILYDFIDRDFRSLLKDQWVFRQLDRLADKNLSIFYLHSGRRETVQRFNDEFLERLHMKEPVMFPCVVFFRLKDEKITDVGAVHLESADLIHGLPELHKVIENYISESPVAASQESKSLRWMKSGAKFISLETVRAFIDACVSGMM